MKYTKGPWELVSTVSSDRKNLFGVFPNREYHIGTLVSGSRSRLALFRSNLSLITYSPLMYELLLKLRQQISDETRDRDTKDTSSLLHDLLNECDDLISKIKKSSS